MTRPVRNSRPPRSRRALALGVVAGAILAASPPAVADPAPCDGTDAFPCTNQLTAVRLQKVGPLLKLQANVTQAQIPIGEGLFTDAWVKLVSGTTELCSETFKSLRVVDGVINLEIGRNMDCELDEVVADHDNLATKLCVGNPTNCLPIIPLGASPWAIKTSFVATAQQAHEVNQVGQAHYAHRISADRAMWTTGRLGTGYFDFVEADAARAVELWPNAAEFQPSAGGGFLQWTPVRSRTAMSLHLASASPSNGRLAPLSHLVLAAEHTQTTGALTVKPAPRDVGVTLTARGAHVTGHSSITGRLGTTGALTVHGGGLHVTGHAAVGGTLAVSAGLSVDEGGLYVTGDSRVEGRLDVSERLAVSGGGARVVGGARVGGPLVVKGTDAEALSVIGAGTLTAGLAVRDGVFVEAGGLRSGGLLNVADGGLHVTGDAGFANRLSAQRLDLIGSAFIHDDQATPRRVFQIAGGSLELNPGSALADSLMNGQWRFLGQVTFDAGVTDPRQGQTFVTSANERRDLVFGGSLSVLDTLALTGGVEGGLAVSGMTTIVGAVSMPQGVTGDLAVGGGLTAGGGALTLGARFLAGVSGNVRQTGGGLGLTGGVTAGGTVAAGTDLGVARNLGLSGGLTVGGAAVIQGTTRFESSFPGNTTISGRVNVPGMMSVRGDMDLTKGGKIGGAVRIAGITTFTEPISGLVVFADNVTVTEDLALTGNTNVETAITIGGETTFEGPVEFNGTFAGTTRFSSITASGEFSINGVSHFAGPVTISGRATGLDDLGAYVKAVGETRNIRVPSLTITGDMTSQETLEVIGGFRDMVGATLRATAAMSVKGRTAVQGDFTGRGDLLNARCRLCINYADNDGNTARKHICTRLYGGANSGLLPLSGDVNGDDVLQLKYLCDNGGNSAGAGWK